jgi:REP element-mobilizing transposase RayT
MARLPRVVIVDVPHHVTQRGNARQVILASDADRITYLELLREYSQLYALSLLGYCLMSNHVHLIAIPQTPQALSQSLKQAHGRYAAYWNAQRSSTGHVWQGRFYSCPLDESHLEKTGERPVCPAGGGMGRLLPNSKLNSGAEVVSLFYFGEPDRSRSTAERAGSSCLASLTRRNDGASRAVSGILIPGLRSRRVMIERQQMVPVGAYVQPG